MKQILLFLAAILFCNCSSDSEVNANVPTNAGKTLVVYYSYTGNCRAIVNTLTSQIHADVLEIQPAEKGLKYEANNYALGTQLLNAIKANPNSASSYPAIDPVTTSLSDYKNIIIVTPLWWSQMAAIMQSYLFNYGSQMAGKSVGLIVSSHSSGISGVVSDARRLLPDVTWMGEQAPITYEADDYGGFEKVGALGRSFTRSDQQMTTQAGDVILYNGNNMVLFYGSNSWSYTRLGRIQYETLDELKSFLKAGKGHISVTLSLTADETAIRQTKRTDEKAKYYSLNGMPTSHPTKGIYIKDGKKYVR